MRRAPIAYACAHSRASDLLISSFSFLVSPFNAEGDRPFLPRRVYLDGFDEPRGRPAAFLMTKLASPPDIDFGVGEWKRKVKIRGATESARSAPSIAPSGKRHSGVSDPRLDPGYLNEQSFLADPQYLLPHSHGHISSEHLRVRAGIAELGQRTDPAR